MKELIRSGTQQVLKIRRRQGVEYLVFPKLEQTGVVSHLFSTRLGGVSTGHLGSMNLSYARGDKETNVDENFRRIARALGRSPEDFVCSDQTHTVNIRTVTRADAGKGVVRPRDYTDVDALVTDVPGLVLSTFYADCVPLYFVDPVKRAVGLAHSGWRGTAGRIGALTVRRMEEEYACRPQDIIAAVGPSICKDCYEIGGDVAEQFKKEFPDCGEFLFPGREGKFQLDLWQANVRVLTEAGLLREHISVTDLCTCCNPDYLFSHRASGGKRGNLGAFLSLN